MSVIRTLIYWERHFIPRRHLRSIFVRCLEQFLKGLVSWGSPAEYFMIDRFLGDAVGVLSCQFWSTVLQYGARLPIYTLKFILLDRVVSGARFLNGGVFKCDIAHRLTVAVLCMHLYKIMCNPMHHLYVALPVPVRVTRGALVAHRYVHLAVPQYLAVPQDLHSPLIVHVERSCWNGIRRCGTGGFQDQSQCFFIGLSFSIYFCLLLFFNFSYFCL